jgi:hypothetical protein
LDWDPDERDAWVADAQRWICDIIGVLDCKIELDPDGEIACVHVVAGKDREPRHIVRDVESLLKARVQKDVYYKKISLVQMMGSPTPEPGEGDVPKTVVIAAGNVSSPSGVTIIPPDPDGPEDPDDVNDDPATARWTDRPDTPPAATVRPEIRAVPDPDSEPLPAPIPAVLVAEGLTPRITCGGVGVLASDMTVSAEVYLRAGEVEARGKREGPNHADSDVQLIARATLDALAELLLDPVLLHLNEIRIENLGGKSVVMAAVDLVEGRASNTLYGTCSTRHNRQQAVVHAVLDALNRRMSIYALKSASRAAEA